MFKADSFLSANTSEYIARAERAGALQQLRDIFPPEIVEKLATNPDLTLVHDISGITAELLSEKIAEGLSPKKLSLDAPIPRGESQLSKLAELSLVVEEEEEVSSSKMIVVETDQPVRKPQITATVGITFIPAGGYYRPAFFTSGKIFASPAFFTDINLNKLRGHGFEIKNPRTTTRPFTQELSQTTGNLKISGNAPAELPPSRKQIAYQMQNEAVRNMFFPALQAAAIDYAKKTSPSLSTVRPAFDGPKNIPITDEEWVQKNISDTTTFNMHVATIPRPTEMGEEISLESGDQFEKLPPRTNPDASVEIQSYQDLEYPEEMAKQLAHCLRRCYSAMDLVIQCMTDRLKTGNNKKFRIKTAGYVGMDFKKDSAAHTEEILKKIVE